MEYRRAQTARAKGDATIHRANSTRGRASRTCAASARPASWRTTLRAGSTLREWWASLAHRDPVLARALAVAGTEMTPEKAAALFDEKR
jgi:hypothetical protein